MHLNVAIPEAHVSANVLNAGLEAVTRLNESLLKSNAVPPFETLLKRGLKWKPEPWGEEHFDHMATLAQRGWGDCDDLAPAHAASLRHSGEDPKARAVVRRTGPKMWHAVTERGDGSIDDPSKRAGMGQPHEYAGHIGHRGASIPRMFAPQAVGGAYIIRPQLALRPVWGGEGWEARTDLPWHYRQNPDAKPSPTDYAMASLHAAPVAHTALTGAIEGAIELAEAAGFAHPDHLDRLCCLGDALDGADYHELVREYGPHHAQAVGQLLDGMIGGLKFGDILKKGFGAVTKFAAPLAASFVPGGSAALNLAKGAASMIRNRGASSAPQAAPAVTPPAYAGMPGASAIMQPQRRMVVTFE